MWRICRVRPGVLLLVESKAKRLRSVAGHRGNVRKIESDIKASIQAGYDQAELIARYVLGWPAEAPFFDEKGNEILRLRRADVGEIFCIVFTDHPCGLIGADLLPWLVVQKTLGVPWVVDHDTFELIALKIDSFDKLVDFLRWRRSIHGRAFVPDEAVYAGFFVQHGAAEIPKDSVAYFDDDYADILEAEYFNRKGVDVAVSSFAVSPPNWASAQKRAMKVIGDMHKKVQRMEGLVGDTVKSVRK